MNDASDPSQPQQQPPRSISEISHLFLSSVRDKHTNGSPRPVRTPPGGTPPPPPARETYPHPAPQHSIDLTPEEYAQVFGSGTPVADASTAEAGGGHATVRIPPVTAVIAQHLNGRAPERVRDYARHLAANGERVGVLELDATEIRLSCFERSITPNDGDPQPAETTEHVDPRFLTEALDEMSWDLDRWLLVLPNLRTPEARDLLKQVDRWTLLSTCDHDGVVSCYRTLKGLANLGHPRMTLALMETAGEAQAAKVFRKLASVCLQFLGIELAGEPAVRSTRAVAEHQVLHCRPTRDKAQLAAGAVWTVIADFLAKAAAQAADDAAHDAGPQVTASEDTAQLADAPEIAAPSATAQPAAPIVETVMPVSPTRQEPFRMTRELEPVAVPTAAAPAAPAEAISEVIDLADGADGTTVLAAILGGTKGDLIEIPVRAPMCPDARLAVTRDRGLILLAVAARGLSDLRAIAQSYRWLTENRALIGMAVPQLAIDAHRLPRLRLLVDHADLSAEVLAPMLESNTVSVQAYRKLRWGNRTGLLLDAA
jgi:hypothetical protein